MLQHYNSNKILLIILDGWGNSNKYHGNAIKQAYTPTLDLLWHNYPSTLVHASENHVGLPSQQVGNSEVGHTTIGAGRIINQALVRISENIDAGIFFNNEVIHRIYKAAQSKRKQVHLIGLCSDGGVHSHIEHLIALIKISRFYTDVRTCIHVITDGRDTEPQSASHFISLILQEIQDTPNIKICTISGRYYGMDRDCRWQRTMKMYECLTENTSREKYKDNPFQVLQDQYEKNIYDEFILPTRINRGAIEEEDGAICFNFRPDRMRQLSQALCSSSFEGFIRKVIYKINLATFTTYDNKFKLPVVFRKIINNNFLGQIISEKGLRQFRLAETEKYAHITYFFNGGRETPFPGEYRELIPSPRVETYDLTPEMSAFHITDKLIKAVQENKYQFIAVNYANSDMIGHTGQLKASKKAVEIIDKSIGELINSISINEKIKIIVTADHGNADMMLDCDNRPFKSHTRNLVPLIIIDSVSTFNKIRSKKMIKLKKGGSLADIAPTILDIMQIEQPDEMDGMSLIAK